jgi:hypothetical protein
MVPTEGAASRVSIQQGAHDLRQLANAQDAAAVGDRRLARHQAQHDRRQELSESDESQIERAMRQIVDLPADRDPLHLHRDHRSHAPTERQSKIAMSEGRARVRCFTRGRHDRARGYV